MIPIARPIFSVVQTGSASQFHEQSKIYILIHCLIVPDQIFNIYDLEGISSVILILVSLYLESR